MTFSFRLDVEPFPHDVAAMKVRAVLVDLRAAIDTVYGAPGLTMAWTPDVPPCPPTRRADVLEGKSDVQDGTLDVGDDESAGHERECAVHNDESAAHDWLYPDRGRRAACSEPLDHAFQRDERSEPFRARVSVGETCSERLARAGFESQLGAEPLHERLRALYRRRELHRSAICQAVARAASLLPACSSENMPPIESSGMVA